MQHEFSRRPVFLASSVMLGAAFMAACGDAGGEPGDEPIGATQEGVRNGTVVNPFGPGIPAQGTRAIVSVGCTGTLIQPSWVVSAGHCNIPVGAPVTSIRPGPDVVRTVDVRVESPDPGSDALLLHLDSPITDVTPATLYSGKTTNLYGKQLDCYGYGAQGYTGSCTSSSQCASGQWCQWGVCMIASTDLRKGTFTAEAFWDNPNNLATFTIPMNSSGQTLLPGDSGGPCFYQGAIAGTDYFGGLTVSHESAVPAVRDWLRNPSRMMFTVADFNGDNRDDVIITNNNGSYWYYSTGWGTWNWAYTRLDLPLGSVKFTVGKFNLDNYADMIVSTNSGSDWYYSTSTPGVWNIAYSRSDLPKWKVRFTPADFDADGRVDLIIQDDTGSYWHRSTGFGTWSQFYSRTDLPTGVANYVIGNFDGALGKDMIITTAVGSYWYYATSQLGNWNVAYTRNDLPLQTVQYTPGDFNGDGKTDIIVTVPTGSFWYYSTGLGTFNDTVYNRYDAPLGLMHFVPGNFDGDAYTDVIISLNTGSFWYYGTSSGVPVEAYTRYDAPWPGIQYTVGNFDGTNARQDMIITINTGSFWYYSTGRGTWDQPYPRYDLPM